MASGTILIIEDNAVNMKLFTLMLETAGYTVIGAENAEVGLPLAEMKQPDLILMDIGLPGMDGLEATRRLKQNPRTRHIPVVAVTAHSLRSDREQALAAGCSDFLAKPSRMKDFLDCVAANMPRTARSTDPSTPN
jgi:CheY-like chemotaxis protein